MSDVERRNAVDKYIDVREQAYSRIRDAFVDRFGDAAAEKYLGGTGKASPSSTAEYSYEGTDYTFE